jgi:hypothetical protein
MITRISMALALIPGCQEPLSGPPASLAAGDFVQIAAGGIDDRVNSYPWAVAPFDGDGDGEDELYVGTLGNALCIQVPQSGTSELLVLGPPAEWQCDTAHWGDSTQYLLDNVAESVVFRGTRRADGTFAWARVFEPDLLEGTGFRGAVVYDGALYMAAMGLLNGAMIWRTTDGVNWEEASDRGVIAEHAAVTQSVRGLIEFDGKLYAASASGGFLYVAADPRPGQWALANDEGMIDSGAPTEETVYFSGTSTGGNTESTLEDVGESFFTLVSPALLSVRLTAGTGAGQERSVASLANSVITIDGTWDTVPDETSTYEVFRADAPVNGPFWDLAVLGDRLYTAPLNMQGGELWYATDPAPGQWTRVIEGGFGQSGTQGFMDLTVHDEQLFLSTVVYPPLIEDTAEVVATEVLRVSLDGTVELLVGETRDPGTPEELAPLSGMGPGFDYGANLYGWEAASFGGRYYLGTFDAALLVLDPLDDLFPDGLPADVQAEVVAGLSADEERWRGFDLYSTVDGVSWTEVATDGFGNRDNYGVRAMELTPWGLVLGAANPIDGFELYLAPVPTDE